MPIFNVKLVTGTIISETQNTTKDNPREIQIPATFFNNLVKNKEVEFLMNGKTYLIQKIDVAEVHIRDKK